MGGRATIRPVGGHTEINCKTVILKYSCPKSQGRKLVIIRAGNEASVEINIYILKCQKRRLASIIYICMGGI